MPRLITVDGNQAAVHASYKFTEVAAIYPITPSSTMAEEVDEWSSHGRKNIFGQEVKVVQMQSEAGAAGAMHGSLQAGALTSTYTASQGLLLMIPNIYKMAGELLPGVIHVSARAIATHALSIFGDHQDVMACRATGAAMLCSNNPQEVMDLGTISHLSAVRARLPFIHFFDGFRTSHEYRKISVPDDNEIMPLIDFEAIDDFKNRALSPSRPVARGTAQNPDIYFQGREASNPFYNNAADIVQHYMNEYAKITNRQYKLFDYYGSADASYVIVAMGSVCDTIEETIDYLIGRGEKVGLIKVRLYRPFSARHFLQTLPKTVQKIAVLDRTKEPGSAGEPLYSDVCKVLLGSNIQVVGGRYGLGSKDTRPSQIVSVYENLKSEAPKNGFTIGIVDDVTHTSLPEAQDIDTTPEGTLSCKFWGLGSDGTVGANKSAVGIIGDNTDLYVQAYFSYDSKKSGGTTISHLRFGKNPIKSTYLIYQADYIACHNKSFLYNYDITQGLKENGIFVLNCPWDMDGLEKNLPAVIKNYIASKNIRFYTIDAERIASDIGLGNRINMIMQSAFFKLTNVIGQDEAVRFLKESVDKAYGRKGRNVVEMNYAAIDQGMGALNKVQVPESWKTAKDEDMPEKDAPDFIKRIQRVMASNQGDELPVSAFSGMEDGTHPLGTTAFEKRGIAPFIPEWKIERCIQCGQCTFICPHATIRAFLLDSQEAERAPKGFETKKAIGKGFEGFEYRVQVSPLDCTGCGNCADICPAKDKALVMMPAQPQIEAQADNWEFAMTLTEKTSFVDKYTLRGNQFIRPLLEFNGACPGCGETPYIRLLTQLFGDRMMIANATGCSSIWAASSPSIAYTTNALGRGPAWANSLFEDNAEFGYGMYLGYLQQREKLIRLMEQALSDDISDSLKEAISSWLKVRDSGDESKAAADEAIKNLEKEGQNSIINRIKSMADFLVKRSIWMIGGDGWAYDIGYGGVDQVLSTGDDVNIFVMDTEVYSNTGGQSSKATPTSAVAKFASAGKKVRKKDLGLMAMSYGYVYVAQIAMGANMNQTLKAITEAERYNGPSLIIAYSPCISHGIRSGMGTSIAEEKKAVEAGYWHLYRFNPELKKQGKNPFILDSKEPSKSYQDFIKGEVRFLQLKNIFPGIAEDMFALSEEHAKERYDKYLGLSKM